MNHLQVQFLSVLQSLHMIDRKLPMMLKMAFISGVKKISANPDDDEGEPEYKFEWQVNSFFSHEK